MYSKTHTSITDALKRCSRVCPICHTPSFAVDEVLENRTLGYCVSPKGEIIALCGLSSPTGIEGVLAAEWHICYDMSSHSFL